MKSNKFLLAGALLLASLSGRAQSADTTLSIEPVTVQSLRSPIARQDVPYSLTVIGAADIQRTPALLVTDLLPRFVPIESADLQGLMNDIELRGFTASAMGTQRYTRLLLDGMPIGTRYAATTFLSGLSGIEVLQGPFSSLYGSGAMGGVVNLLTPQSKGALAGRLSLDYGSWNTFAANVALGGSLSPKLDFDLGFDYRKRGDDYRTGKSNLLKTTAYEKQVYDPHSYDVAYPNTTFDRTRGMLRLGWDVAENWHLNLYNELYHTGNAPTNGTLWGLYDQIDHKITRNYHRLDFTGTAGRHAIRISPFVSREKSQFADWGMYGNGRRKQDYNTYGFTAQDAVSYDWGSLVFGIDNLSERFNSTKALEDGTPVTPNNPDYSSSATGLFAQLNFRVGNLSGIAGARYDNTLFKTFATDLMEVDPSKKNYASFSPNLSLQYRLSPTMRLRAGVGRAFVAPEAFRLTADYTDGWGYVYKGNPDLKAETATTWELGWNYLSRDRVLELSAALFSTEHKNLIVTDPDQRPVYVYINADRARMQGLQIDASFDLGRALDKEWSWKLRGAYERFFRAEAELSGVTSERLYLSRTKLALGMDFSYRKWSVTLSGRYVGSRKEENWLCSYDYNPPYGQIPFVTADGVTVRPGLCDAPFIQTPDYLVFDASASYRVAKWLTLRAAAANIFNELYMERDGYYMPGRNFQIGLSLNF